MSSRTRAIEFVADLDERQREIVRHNWERLGYVYDRTRQMVEIWRNPRTGHEAELATY